MRPEWKLRLFGYLESGLNHAEETHAELAREAGSTVTWIVGLASAGIALLAANDSVMGILSTRARIAAMGCMLLSISLGVLHRVIVLAYGSLSKVQLFHLRSYLIGRLKGLDGSEIPEADDSWSIEEIAANIQTHFGMRVDYLVSSNVPPSSAIELYQALRNIEYEFFTNTVQEVLSEIAKYGGKEVADTGLTDEKIRARGRQLGHLHLATLISFAASGLSFVVGLLLVAIASF